MKAALSFGVVLLLSVGGSAAAGLGPAFGELPTGRVTVPPAERDRPSAIPARESVPGLRVSLTRSGATRELHVGEGAVAGTCFAQMSNGFSGALLEDDPMRRMEWEQRLAPRLTIYSDPGERPAVTLIHSERVVERSGAFVLESTDAWLDRSTQGVRLIATGAMPLRSIATAAGGLRVLAARDERADGKRFVQFVVSRPKEDAPGTSPVASRDGANLAVGACAHSRVVLPATKGGSTALVELSVVLPDLAPGEVSTATPLPPPPPGANVKDVRMRLMRVHLSVSQTSRDADPVLAASTSWAGPERLARTFAQPKEPPPRPAIPVLKPRIELSRRF